MTNPLKKINFKSNKKSIVVSADAMNVVINELVTDRKKLTAENKSLGFRCQSFELTVREKNREIQQLEQALKEKEAKIAELHKEITEKKMIAAFYERLADKAIQERSQLKMKYCSPVSAGVGIEKNTAKEVTDSAGM